MTPVGKTFIFMNKETKKILKYNEGWVELWHQPDNMLKDVHVQLLSTNMIRFFFAEFWLPTAEMLFKQRGYLTPPKGACSNSCYSF